MVSILHAVDKHHSVGFVARPAGSRQCIKKAGIRLAKARDWMQDRRVTRDLTDDDNAGPKGPEPC
jgi:hypothetical protein